jgi:uncharacterized protein
MATFPNSNASFTGAGSDSRSVFITRTYTHLVGASSASFWWSWRCSNPAGRQIFRFMFGFNWILILGAFMLTGWLATRTAQTSTSIGMQYFAYAACTWSRRR